MFEYHNNILCVQGGWLYEVAQIMSKSNYKLLKHRGSLSVVQRGGNGRPALVDYESIPERFKKKIVEQCGDPYEMVKSYRFSDYLERDNDAYTFYRNYRLENGSSLPDKTINQYCAESEILNAVRIIVTNTAAKRKALGGGSAKIWDKLSTIIQELPSKTYPHALPRNVRSLKRKYKAYNKEGYSALIHKGYANSNSEKINDEAKVWVISRWADRVAKVANLQQLLFEYNEMAIQKNWKQLKEENTLRNYLYKEGVKHLWYGHRYGDSVSKDKFGYKHKTKLPTMRDSLWYSDGTKMNYYYLDADGKMATCQVYEVMDVYSEVLLGYHISSKENYEAQFSAYKMAVKISEHKPYQIGFDGQGGHKKLQSGNFLTKVARLAVKTAPYNGSSKTIEAAFGRFQSQFLKRDWFFTGQNITSKKQESKANREFIMANKASLPTLSEVKEIYAKRRKEWNSAPHPKTGIPRVDMYRNSTNPDTPTVNLWDMVDLFWIQRKDTITCTSSGIKFTENKVPYEYMVYREDNLPDIEWLRNNIDKKFVIKFDPEDMTMIHLYEEDALGLRHVTEAKIKFDVHRGKQEQEAWEAEYLQKVKQLNEEQRIKADEEMDSMLESHGMLPEDYGLKSPGLLGIKSKRKKAPNNIGKIQKKESGYSELEEVDIYDKY